MLQNSYQKMFLMNESLTVLLKTNRTLKVFKIFQTSGMQVSEPCCSASYICRETQLLVCSHILCLNRRAAWPHSAAIHLHLTKPRFQSPKFMNLQIRHPLDSTSTAEYTTDLGSNPSPISKTEKFFLCKLSQKNMVTQKSSSHRSKTSEHF